MMKFISDKKKGGGDDQGQKQPSQSQVYEESELLKNQQKEEKKFITPQKQISNNNNFTPNPYLVFHSPLESDKNLFKKKRKIQKNPLALQQTAYSKIQMSMKLELEEQILEKPSIIFTKTQRQKAPNFGLISITRDQWQKGHTLIYSRRKRCMVRIPVCQKCKKKFINTEALGGHVRACRKK